MSEWQPIETCPKDGTLFDVWDGYKRITDCVFARAIFLGTSPQPDGCVCYSECVDGWRYVWHKLSGATHWMPIPDAPKGE